MASDQDHVDTLVEALVGADYRTARVRAELLLRLCDAGGRLSTRPLVLSALFGAIADHLAAVSNGQTARRVDKVGREVARALRDVGSLGVADVERLNHMSDGDLRRLRDECDRRLARDAFERERDHGRAVVAALEAQRSSPVHRLRSQLVAACLEAYDRTAVDLARLASGPAVLVGAEGARTVDGPRALFEWHVSERLAQPLTAAALLVDVDGEG